MFTFAPELVLWPSGQAAVCKTVYSGSNPLGTSKLTPIAIDYHCFRGFPLVNYAAFKSNMYLSECLQDVFLTEMLIHII